MRQAVPLVALLVLLPASLAGCVGQGEGPVSPAGTEDGDAPANGSTNRSAPSDRARANGTTEQPSDQAGNGTEDNRTDPGGSQEGNRSQAQDSGGNTSTGPWTGDPRVTGLEPLGVIDSLRTTEIRVLLVPPTHGDLGEPTNRSRDGRDYLAATVDALHDWERVIDRFIETYPRYAYLDRIDIQVEILDGETPATLGYDVVVAYLETAGPVFRGAALTGNTFVQAQLDQAGLGDLVHYGDRYILLSLFGASPRADQTVPDYPETREVHDVTMHEFGHTFGLLHTGTWTAHHGPDLMNSPYPFVYGDGDPVGDGGERSPKACISTLNLYGLAHVYRWLPNGTWEGSDGNVTLPDSLRYQEICAPGTTAPLPLPAHHLGTRPVGG